MAGAIIIVFTAEEMEDQRGDIFAQDQPEEPKMYLNLGLSLFLFLTHAGMWDLSSLARDQI